MNFRYLLQTTTILLFLLLMSTLAVAQEPRLDAGEGPGDPELRQALFNYFERRLRTELALTDEQAAEVLPRVEAMEKERAAAMREKRRATVEMRRAYREGSPDAELEHLLQRVVEIEERQHARTRQLMNEIGQSLTVRQRVQFRAFLDRFRQEIRRRVQDSRGPARPGQHGRPGRRPEMDRR